MCVVLRFYEFVFFFKQKTAYEMRISDWSSDVCSSDLLVRCSRRRRRLRRRRRIGRLVMGKIDRLTPEEHAEVTAAVSEAEKTTDGEIVTIVSGRDRKSVV